MELKQNPHSENPTKLKLISPALKHKLHVVTKDGIKHKWNYSKENFLSIAVSCLAQSEGVVWAMEMAKQSRSGLAGLHLSLKSVLVGTQATAGSVLSLPQGWTALFYVGQIRDGPAGLCDASNLNIW